MTVTFKEGMLVKLKSGGPLMVVEGIYPGAGRVVSVMWFDGAKIHHANLSPDVLDIAKHGDTVNG